MSTTTFRKTDRTSAARTVPTTGNPTLLDTLTDAGLTGRGGAAFPAAVKVRAAWENDAALIVNCCDGELGAVKDGWVVTHHLPQLLAGVDLVLPPARGRRPHPPVVFAAHRGSATADRLRAAGVDVLETPHRYVSSEESALVSLWHQGDARPLTKRAPFVYGGRDSHGRRISPTLVLNAETVWRIAQLHERGVAWFTAQGTATEPGPRLLAVRGAVASPGVWETAAGVPFTAVFEAAGGLLPEVEYVLVGGLGGVLLTRAEAESATWSTPGLAPFGGTPGPGVIEALPPERCPVDVVAELLTYGAGESAGQCGPCMFGLPSLAAQWTALAQCRNGQALTSGIDRLRSSLGLVEGRGACRHPDGVARLAGSALHTLTPHLQAHATGRCPTRSLTNVH
ncbi:NADH:ubiquinone oxidoreductase subunit F (NADH-binding) [Kineosphaera limosa]|uniref:Putative formate dehydrogenase beta subunit n=1 Tax=Kineosphaera limosa NBRC 100340 TaxID=1184609 RepID=K6WM58_9MICO|nr:NADH-ubiquinone oxidoreductase-F iron-sulfur binding region domain-containing protein [Kineosphaera limosa]NYE00943.1 NADH:ubiquinone oxidoreductase subunit F (NADH-binding) [Kineosphaera limosa]GAB94861.1 putative formate dehydrogenase beta subunit [Kineosphaera limosa NBRC 100340]